MRLAELAEVLAEHGGLELTRCGVLTSTAGECTIEFAFDPAHIDATEFAVALRRAVDIGTIRVLATRYGIDRERLEALLPQ